MNKWLVRSRSTVGSSNIYFQLTPKYRRKVFENEKIKETCQKVMREIVEALGLVRCALEFGPEHVHLFVGNCMQYSVPELAQRLKGASSRRIRQECWEELAGILQGSSFWSDGYFYEYIGRFTNDAMKYYIERQQGKHWVNENYNYRYIRGTPMLITSAINH